jgi:hypothetical protein
MVTDVDMTPVSGAPEAHAAYERAEAAVEQLQKPACDIAASILSAEFSRLRILHPSSKAMAFTAFSSDLLSSPPDRFPTLEGRKHSDLPTPLEFLNCFLTLDQIRDIMSQAAEAFNQQPETFDISWRSVAVSVPQLLYAPMRTYLNEFERRWLLHVGILPTDVLDLETAVRYFAVRKARKESCDPGTLLEDLNKKVGLDPHDSLDYIPWASWRMIFPNVSFGPVGVVTSVADLRDATAAFNRSYRHLAVILDQLEAEHRQSVCKPRKQFVNSTYAGILKRIPGPHSARKPACASSVPTTRQTASRLQAYPSTTFSEPGPQALQTNLGTSTAQGRLHMKSVLSYFPAVPGPRKSQKLFMVAALQH